MKRPGRSSDIFRFKRFALANTRSAQRVGTDGVIVGAYAPVGDATEIWDVGAGTGLIALMTAQRTADARITAVELDPVAASECSDNVAASPWADRVSVAVGDIADLAPQLPTPDLIVSNPPFFAASADTPDARRSLARHDGSLSPLSLIALAPRWLAPGGKLCFIAPADRTDEIMLEAELQRMVPVEMLDVASRPDREPLRRVWVMMHRSPGRAVATPSHLDIHGAEGGYSDAYIALTRDFYLDM